MAVHATATFYTGSPGPLADGSKFRADRLFCAAGRQVPLGASVLVTCRGRRVRLIVRDRGGFPSRDLDLSPSAFAKLAGRGWRKKGRIGVTWRVVGRKKARASR